jgi:hypothetical protein
VITQGQDKRHAKAGIMSYESSSGKMYFVLKKKHVALKKSLLTASSPSKDMLYFH